MTETMEKTQKNGLILEGGAMRGMFTAGVLDVWMENQVAFDAAIGVSAGAVFGCNYKSLQIGRAIRYNRRFCKEWRYCSLRSWLLTGDIYGADFCYNKLPYELDIFDLETYRANPMDFYVVATDAETGRAAYQKCDRGDGDDMNWYRASASMPVVSKPVTIGGREYLDGGIADSIPVRWFEEHVTPHNVIILTQPEDYRKQKMKHLNAYKPLLRKTPAIFEALSVRHEVYNETVDYIRQKEAAGEVLVIRPAKALGIGSTCHDEQELLRVYEIGREAGEQALPRVMAFMEPEL
ncbi:MAG: patatin family protein [Lachnospiraceae bacterium]|nr:patatin family protein [Lachnospiraceae bacterium]